MESICCPYLWFSWRHLRDFVIPAAMPKWNSRLDSMIFVFHRPVFSEQDHVSPLDDLYSCWRLSYWHLVRKTWSHALHLHSNNRSEDSLPELDSRPRTILFNQRISTRWSNDVLSLHQRWMISNYPWKSLHPFDHFECPPSRNDTKMMVFAFVWRWNRLCRYSSQWPIHRVHCRKHRKIGGRRRCFWI